MTKPTLTPPLKRATPEFCFSIDGLTCFEETTEIVSGRKIKKDVPTDVTRQITDAVRAVLNTPEVTLCKKCIGVNVPMKGLFEEQEAILKRLERLKERLKDFEGVSIGESIIMKG